MAPDREAPVERTRTVLEQGGALFGDAWLEIRLGLSGGGRRPLQEGNDVVEDAPVGGDLEIAAHHVGQPEQIVGDAGADSSSHRGMPPVLDIALDELAGGGSEEMLTREIAPRHGEGEHVLELVPKAVRATGLVEGRARPHAT